MDPVNKWLFTIIVFMAAVVALLFYKAGAGRYEFAVEKSSLFQNHAVVYVLDTKDGDVHAKLVDEDDLHYKNSARNSPAKVFSIPGYTSRRY